MPAWTIMPMTLEDIVQVVAIERTLFSSPWSRQSYENELICESARSYVVRPCGHRLEKQPLIAYAALRLIMDEIQLLRVGVSAARQRQGVASHLINECLIRAMFAGAQNAFLEVRASNAPAIKLYQKLGFRIIGKRPNYYTDTHEDAFMMIKNLKEEQQ